MSASIPFITFYYHYRLQTRCHIAIKVEEIKPYDADDHMTRVKVRPDATTLKTK